ncbi:MAG: hypothetical protein WCG92_04515 [Hyphomicrobiales bacterium]|nr:hypothetical protein [Alphaproteobacteria bacterium]
MSLDMTVGAREAALDSIADETDAGAATAMRPSLQSLMVTAATGVGVTISAALGVVLFLR